MLTKLFSTCWGPLSIAMYDTLKFSYIWPNLFDNFITIQDSNSHLVHLVLTQRYLFRCVAMWLTVLSSGSLGAVSIRKTVLPGMVIPMLKIRRSNGRLILTWKSPYVDKTVFILRRGPAYDVAFYVSHSLFDGCMHLIATKWTDQLRGTHHKNLGNMTCCNENPAYY